MSAKRNYVLLILLLLKLLFSELLLDTHMENKYHNNAMYGTTDNQLLSPLDPQVLVFKVS